MGTEQSKESTPVVICGRGTSLQKKDGNSYCVGNIAGCGSNSSLVDGECVSKIGCGELTSLVDGKCVPQIGCGEGTHLFGGKCLSTEIVIPQTAASWVPAGGCAVPRHDFNYVELRQNTPGIIPADDVAYCNGSKSVPTTSTDTSLCTATKPCYRCMGGKVQACKGRDNPDKIGSCNDLHGGYYMGSIGASFGHTAMAAISACEGGH